MGFCCVSELVLTEGGIFLVGVDDGGFSGFEGLDGGEFADAGVGAEEEGCVFCVAALGGEMDFDAFACKNTDLDGLGKWGRGFEFGLFFLCERWRSRKKEKEEEDPTEGMLKGVG